MELARLILDYIKVIIWPTCVLAIVYGFRGALKELIHRVRSLSAPGVDAEFSERVIEASIDTVAAIRESDPQLEDPGQPPTGRSTTADHEPELLSEPETAPSRQSVPETPSPELPRGPAPVPPPTPTPAPPPAPAPPSPEAAHGPQPGPAPSAPQGHWKRSSLPPGFRGYSGALLASAHGDDEWGGLLATASLSPASAVLGAYVQVELALRLLAESRGLAISKKRAVDRDLLERLHLPENVIRAFNELRAVRNRVAHLREATPNSLAARSYVDSCRQLVEWLQHE